MVSVRVGGRVVYILETVLRFGILAAVFLLSTSLMIYVAMHESAVVVPNLLGKTLFQAQQSASQLDLKIEVKNRVYDERNPENTIVEQWPKAGMTIKKGQALRVNTSLGPRVARRETTGGN